MEQSYRTDFLHLLLETNENGRASKRVKSSDREPIDSRRLPAVKQSSKRLRIPPTLSGLHQPPPDAGLLPSMSIAQPVIDTIPGLSVQHDGAKHQVQVGVSERLLHEVQTSVPVPTALPTKRKHRKWSEDETAGLLQGVSRFGVGQWTKILHCPDYRFDGRTAVDLKDRFRVCCPAEYVGSRAPRPSIVKGSDELPEQLISEAVKWTRVRAKKSQALSAAQRHQLGLEKPFDKSKQRQRREYTEAEDAALLRGFDQYGHAWSSILKSEEALIERSAYDLRDRFRTRFPKQYAKAGLALRSRQGPRPTAEKVEIQSSETTDMGATRQAQTALVAQKTLDRPSQRPDKYLSLEWQTRSQPPSSLFPADDAFWGALFEPDDTDAEPITLDRGILDWAYDTSMRPSASQSNAEKAGETDSSAALDLLRPVIVTSRSISVPLAQTNGRTAALPNALPSLATITAGPWGGHEGVVDEQLELPSLLSDSVALEAEGRSGGQFMSMEELLS